MALDKSQGIVNRRLAALIADDDILDVRRDHLLRQPDIYIPDIADLVFHAGRFVELSIRGLQVKALAGEIDGANAGAVAPSCFGDDDDFFARLFHGLMCSTSRPRSQRNWSATSERWQAAASRSTQQRAKTWVSGPASSSSDFGSKLARISER